MTSPLPPDTDRLLALLLVEQGLIQPEHVKDWMREQAECASRGAAAPKLSELLVRRGYLKCAAGGAEPATKGGKPRFDLPGPPDLPTEAAFAATNPENRVGRYIRIVRLGAGGKGDVWKAWDTELRRWVALKFLRQHLPEEVARFKHEAQTAAGLSHPNIAAVYEATDDYIAMQFIEGRTLANFTRDDIRVLVEIMVQASFAVHHAHAHGFVHRDLKPANIMITSPSGSSSSAHRATGSNRRVTSTPHVYVMDFGLAKSINLKQGLTVTGYVVGTPAYMSPEQAWGNGRVDARSDVYSLGTTLYELLTRQPPFRDNNVYKLLRKVVEADPRPVRALRPEVDRDLETIVMKCLEKDPARRYQTAMALAEDLAHWLDGDPIMARPATMTYRIWKRTRKPPLLVGAALLLLAPLAFASWFSMPSPSLPQASAHERVAQAKRLVAALPEDARDAIKTLVKADDLLGPAGGMATDDRYQVNRKLGDLALAAHDFGLARLAYSRCDQLRPGENLQGLVDVIEGLSKQEDESAPRRRRQRLQEILHDLQLDLERPDRPAGAPTIDDYLFECVRFNDEQTVRALSDLLRPLVERDKDKVSWTRQEQDLIAFAFNALGRMDVDSAFVFLADTMKVLSDETLAGQCAIALCLTRRAGAQAVLLEALNRPDIGGALCTHVAPYVSRVPDPDGRLRRHVSNTWTQRGVDYYDKNDLDAAIQACAQAIQLNPGDTVALTVRSASYCSKGLLKEAVADASRAIQADPRYAAAYGNRGYAHVKCDNLDAAIEDYSQAIAIDPREASFFANRAQARLLKGDVNGAMQDASQAVELDPKNAFNFHVRGMIRLKSADVDGAISDYTRALGLAPSYAAALQDRGAALLAAGDLTGAISDWERFLKLAPDDPNANQVREALRRARK
ncbi:MAG: tetratricopeptide repeat protein [Planctomycetes bacterium]|nr:tetratricopeptide repeat protein [Planctomycetota bacterium]